MSDHTLSVEWDPQGAPTLRFSAIYNASAHMIDRHVDEGRGEKAAIVTATETVTYGELATAVRQAAAALRDLGLGPGDRLLLVVADCPVFFYLFWGAIRAGIVPVPLNTLLRAVDYEALVEDSGADVLVYSRAFEAELPQGQQLRWAVPVEGDGGMAARIHAASSANEPIASRPEDDCFWLYSSGSTGQPKGAVHRHRDVAVTCVCYAEGVLRVSESDVCFSAAKLFFAYGLGNAMTFPLFAGATAVLSEERPTPESTFDTIERFRPTLYFGVPTLYAHQLRTLETSQHDLSSLRACVSAGEPLPPDLFRRWQERTGLEILDGIGSTELLHIFISNRLGSAVPGTSGTPVPAYRARVLGDDGSEVARGETGRLWVVGASAARCYWNRPEQSAQTFRGEWTDTGDSYAVDEQGLFVYQGRGDDMLKVGGRWVSPTEIEACLVEHAQVLEAAVVGHANEDELVKAHAYVVLNEPEDAADALAEALKQHCRERLAPYKRPEWLEFVSELPKTATGKIRRFALRKS